MGRSYKNIANFAETDDAVTTVVRSRLPTGNNIVGLNILLDRYIETYSEI